MLLAALPLALGPIDLAPVADGLDQPTSVTHLGSSLLVTEKPGRIVRIRPDGTVRTWAKVDTSADGERGLLSIVPLGPKSYYAAFTAGNGDLRVTLTTGRVSKPILRVPHREYSNHNGGQLQLHDGLLYISTGDGGGAGDPFDSARRTRDLRGKILRIDPTCGKRYCIPAANPRRSPVIARGLRNPWRFSIDPVTDQIWIGDVGQGAYEEIDRMPVAGPLADFGWSCREGPAVFQASRCAGRRLTEPILSYGRDVGQSVTGGYVYRGSDIPRLRGWYVFGDFMTGAVWAYRDGRRIRLATADGLTSFGVDRDGELLVATIDGQIRRLQD